MYYIYLHVQIFAALLGPPKDIQTIVLKFMRFFSESEDKIDVTEVKEHGGGNFFSLFICR